MSTITVADEIEAMIMSGTIDPRASHAALVHMAERWLADQHRRRMRAEARHVETAATHRTRATAITHERVTALAARIVERTTQDWGQLLDKAFALADGTRVTWGEATVEQHEARADMLKIMAAGDLETAALHMSAVRDIRAGNAETLGEVFS